MQPVANRHVLDDEPERADVVGGRQHVVVAKIDFVLSRRDLVVRRLDVKSHRLEREDDLAPHVLAHVDRAQVEVARRVVRFGCRDAILRLEQKELGLGSGVHRIALRRGQRDDLLQAGARIAGERLTVGRVDVADHPRDSLAGRPGPRKHPEGREIGPQVHVRLFDANESLDRGAVEHDFSVERLLELAVGDLDVLDRAEDVGELQAHELDLFALDALEDLRPGFADGRRCGSLGHIKVRPVGATLVVAPLYQQPSWLRSGGHKGRPYTARDSAEF